MDILVISDYYPPYIKGGAEVSTSLLVDWLVAKGSVVTVYCNNRIADHAWSEKGVPVDPIIWFAQPGDRGIFSALVYMIGIVLFPLITAVLVLKKVSILKPDLVQVVPSNYQFIPTILCIRWFTHIPVVVDCRDHSLICPVQLSTIEDAMSHSHGYRCLKNTYKIYSEVLIPFRNLFALYESLVFNLNKGLLRRIAHRDDTLRFVAVSEYMEHQLVLNNFPKRSVKVIPNIAPLHEDREIQYDDVHIKNFAFAGRIEREKGVWDMLDAMELLAKEGYDCTLEIAGDGEDMPALKAYLDQHDIPGVSLVGKLTPADVLGLYARSLAIIGPSRFPEPMGRFVLEAASVGKPVIVTRSGGIPEFVEEGVTGFIVDIGNSRQLADAMKVLLNDPTRTKEMRTAILKKSKEFSADVIGQKRLDCYTSIIAVS